MSLFHTADPATAHYHLQIARANVQLSRSRLFEMGKQQATHGFSAHNAGFLQGIAYAAFILDLTCGTKSVGPTGKTTLGGDCDLLVEQLNQGLFERIVLSPTQPGPLSANISLPAIPAAPQFQEVA